MPVRALAICCQADHAAAISGCRLQASNTLFASLTPLVRMTFSYCSFMRPVAASSEIVFTNAMLFLLVRSSCMGDARWSLNPRGFSVRLRGGSTVIGFCTALIGGTNCRRARDSQSVVSEGLDW